MTNPGPPPGATTRIPAPAPTASPAPAPPTATELRQRLPMELLKPQYNELGPVPLVPANLPAEMRA